MKLFRTDYPLTPSFDLIRPSLQLLRDNIWPVFYLAFLPSLFTVVGSVLVGDVIQPGGKVAWSDRASLGLLIVFIGAIWLLLTYPATLIMQLDAVRGKSPAAWDCFKRGLRFILPMIVTVLLFEIAIVAGLFALIIPGLILLRSYYLSTYYVVDQKLGPIQALKKSRLESKPNAGYIWGVIGTVLLLAFVGNLLGRIPVVGYLLTMIVALLYTFAPAIRYDEIKNLKLSENDTLPAGHPRTT